MLAVSEFILQFQLRLLLSEVCQMIRKNKNADAISFTRKNAHTIIRNLIKLICNFALLLDKHYKGKGQSNWEIDA